MKEQKSRKEPSKETGTGKGYSTHYPSICASHSGLHWLLQSYRDMTQVNFYETDLNKVSTVQSPTLLSITVSNACPDSHYTVRASARVYQLSLYKAKTATVALKPPEVIETCLHIGKEL